MVDSISEAFAELDGLLEAIFSISVSVTKAVGSVSCYDHSRSGYQNVVQNCPNKMIGTGSLAERRVRGRDCGAPRKQPKYMQV